MAGWTSHKNLPSRPRERRERSILRDLPRGCEKSGPRRPRQRAADADSPDTGGREIRNEIRNEIEGLIRGQTLVSRVVVTPQVAAENGTAAVEELVDAF